MVKEILDETERWLRNGDPVALATVIATERSAPHDPGAALAVRKGPEVVGSVSGGCVEGAVVDEALQVLETGAPRRLSYGIADELALNVGLTCGGTIHLLVERLDWSDLFYEAAAAIKAERPVSVLRGCTMRHATGISEYAPRKRSARPVRECRTYYVMPRLK